MEGGQREINEMSNRSDNWGFVVPFLVGNWPDFFGQWRFTLVALQLAIFWTGLWLLMSKSWNDGKAVRIAIIVLTLFGSVFVSQLWRDASLLALATLGLGLLAKSIRYSNNISYILFFPSILILHFAAMFKILYGPVLGLFVFWILFQSQDKRRALVAVSLAASISLTMSPYILDKQLTSYAEMQKVFPEQQPIIFDLASSYCWGTSPGLVQDAAKAIGLVMQPNYPMASICASLKPNRWDSLSDSEDDWIFNSPIRRITGDSEDKVENLRARWIAMIINNPIDWIQVRLMYLGWTLTLSNSFIPQDESNTWEGALGEVNKFAWSVIFAFASVMDKTRISSILFAFFVLSMLFIRSQSSSGVPRTGSSIPRSDVIIGYLAMIMTTGLTLVGFVASNGRYVLPYVLLVYILLIRSYSLRTPKM